MEKYDPRMARRVWDRVLAQPEEKREQFGQFLLWESQLAAEYVRLSRQYPEMKKLAEETKKILACLRGMRIFTQDQHPAPLPVKPRQERPEAALRRCYFQCLTGAQAYEALAQEPEFGGVYAQLGQTKRRHCRLLLEITGGAGEK